MAKQKNIRSEFQLQLDSLVIVSCILTFFAVVYIGKVGLIRIIILTIMDPIFEQHLPYGPNVQYSENSGIKPCQYHGIPLLTAIPRTHAKPQ